MVFERVSGTWMTKEARDEMYARASEARFRARPRQGYPSAPMVIRDTMDPIQSQLDGKYYDSKRKLRQTYREGGVVEVGDEKTYTDPEYIKPGPINRVEPPGPSRRECVERAISQTNLTSYRHEEIK